MLLQTLKGGLSETRIEKRIVITGDCDIDHDQVSSPGAQRIPTPSFWPNIAGVRGPSGIILQMCKHEVHKILVLKNILGKWWSWLSKNMSGDMSIMLLAVWVAQFDLLIIRDAHLDSTHWAMIHLLTCSSIHPGSGILTFLFLPSCVWFCCTFNFLFVFDCQISTMTKSTFFVAQMWWIRHAKATLRRSNLSSPHVFGPWLAFFVICSLHKHIVIMRFQCRLSALIWVPLISQLLVPLSPSREPKVIGSIC